MRLLLWNGEKSYGKEDRKRTGNTETGQKDTLTDDLGLCDDHGGILCLCGIRQLIFGSELPGTRWNHRYRYYLKSLFGIETGTWMLLINIPILLIGIWKFGLRFILSTIYCTAMTSLFTNLLTPVGAVTTDPLLASLTGSALMAVSMGWVFKADPLRRNRYYYQAAATKFPYLKTGALFFLTDVVIVIASAFVFRNIDKALYAGIVVIITSVVLDVVLYGRDEAKLIYIISDHAEKIAGRLLEELDIGVTYVQGSGAYSGKEKSVIMCAMKKNISPKAEEIVKEEDPLAFMIVTSATEIFGEGYKSYFSEKL